MLYPFLPCPSEIPVLRREDLIDLQHGLEKVTDGTLVGKDHDACLSHAKTGAGSFVSSSALETQTVVVIPP